MSEDRDLPPDYLNTHEADYERIRRLPLEQRMIEYEKLAAKTRESLSQSDETIAQLWAEKSINDAPSLEIFTSLMDKLQIKI